MIIIGDIEKYLEDVTIKENDLPYEKEFAEMDYEELDDEIKEIIQEIDEEYEELDDEFRKAMQEINDEYEELDSEANEDVQDYEELDDDIIEAIQEIDEELEDKIEETPRDISEIKKEIEDVNISDITGTKKFIDSNLYSKSKENAIEAGEQK